MQTNPTTNSLKQPVGKSKAAADSKAKRPRGFAAMDPEQQRKIASEGGKASHESGRGHRFTAEEARAAGRKGGQATRKTPTAKA
ncbi:KGG domain-containing protein [Hymenobacter norwichensis]|uniref:KGG domain-containing protein n=1 Tax=Hymenobacter norwichensis TaxID=223903 RepID=UPI0003B36F28|nr:KGG domain-containing protein [Hymenobacter norwichensis]